MTTDSLQYNLNMATAQHLKLAVEESTFQVLHLHD